MTIIIVHMVVVARIIVIAIRWVCCHHWCRWGLWTNGLWWLDKGVNQCFERDAEGSDLSSNLREIHQLTTFMVMIGVTVIGR